MKIFKMAKTRAVMSIERKIRDVNVKAVNRYNKRVPMTVEMRKVDSRITTKKKRERREGKGKERKGWREGEGETWVFHQERPSLH